jgi:hypothetical protein
MLPPISNPAKQFAQRKVVFVNITLTNNIVKKKKKKKISEK